MITGLQKTEAPARTAWINLKCPLCKQDDFKVKFPATVAPHETLSVNEFNCTNPGHGRHFQIVRCLQCCMTYCTPRPALAEILEAYTLGEDPTYVEEEQGRTETFQRVLRSFAQTKGRLLDIGCNTGVFMAEAQTAGFEVFGVEPSRYAAGLARREKGLNVHCGVVPCSLPWKELFDVVTMWDVIEHVDDPLEIMRFIRSSLKAGGEFHLATMNVESLYARIAGHRWPWYMLMHLHYFSPKTIAAMLRQAGFSTVRIGRYAHVVHKRYLKQKLHRLDLFSKTIGTLGAKILGDRSGFVAVDLGDMMHVVAR